MGQEVYRTHMAHNTDHQRALVIFYWTSAFHKMWEILWAV